MNAGTVAMIAGGLIVLLAMVSFMGGMGFGGDPSDPVPDWQYDDYRDVTDETAATGSLEIVTYAGKTYVHAGSLGEGTVTHSDGKTETYTVKKALLDVILIWGQSNSAMFIRDSTTADAPSPGTSYYFGNSTQYATTGITAADFTGWTWQTMLDDNGACKVGDKGPSICKTYTEATGHKAYLIGGGIGSRSIAAFFPGYDVWDYCKALLASAMGSIDRDKYEVSILPFLWVQGESDQYGGTSSDTYARAFGLMLDLMESGEIGYKFPGAVVCLLEDRFVIANGGLEKIAASRSDVRIGASAKDFTIADGTLGNDALHYSQKGDNIIGTEFGRALSGESDEKAPWMDIADLIPMLLIIMSLIGVVGVVVYSQRD